MYIYNTLTKQKELLKTAEEGKVKIYNCGPTVYGYFHIGNARNFVVFDVLRRFLEYKGNQVTFVQNITDIDDKIIKRAKEEKTDWKEIVKKYTDAYFEDINALNVKLPDISPKATEHVDDMIAVIVKLIEKGIAYELAGDVYYDITKFDSYGRLSAKKIEELEAGARIEIDKRKRQPLDFALWKKAKPDEPNWPSPWGNGRPGWHIECSVMSRKYLGDTFDIHGGGIDLVFPHHENEIAQTEAVTGKPFVRYWLHNGHVNIKGEKMAKSVGNIKLVRELKQKFSPMAIRYFLLSAHYRSPLDFSEEAIKSFEKGYEEFYNSFARLKELCETSTPNAQLNELETKSKEMKEKFIASLEDDLNTALALSSLFEFAREIKQAIATQSINNSSQESLRTLLKTFYECSGILGIAPVIKEFSDEIHELIKKREGARKTKDWSAADRIREVLKEKGILLEDTPTGTIPIKKR